MTTNTYLPVAVRVLRLGAVITAMMALAAGSAAAESGAGKRSRRSCTNADLRGTFAFTAQGVTLATSPVPAPLQGPFASSGVSTFDGRGHFSLTATSSFNGVVRQPATVKGTYGVNADCTYTSQAENGVTFQAAIVSGGDEVLIIQTTPGVAISGVAQRQRAHDRAHESVAYRRSLRCENATVRGTYGFLANGVAGPPTVPPELAGPLVGVGTVTFDKEGAFTLTATRSVNGVLDPAPLTLPGTYAFSDGCSFRMAFDVGFTFTAALVDGGQEIVFIETDPGTTLIVRAKRQ